MTGVTAKGAITRQRIVVGAAEVVRQAGVEGATLVPNRPAYRNQPRSLFHYFPDGRRQLLLAVAAYEADRVLSDQQPHLSALTSWDA